MSLTLSTMIFSMSMVCNYELWENFGGEISDFSFDGSSNPAYFWAVYPEWFILRPQKQDDGMIAHNILMCQRFILSPAERVLP